MGYIRQGFYWWHACEVSTPGTRGRHRNQAALSFERIRLTTDAVGTTTLTLNNVVGGSRYRIERQGDGSLATPTGNAEGVAGGTTVNITLDYYAAGNANNDIRIKVRKGSAVTRYKPYETQATLGASSQSVYIAQVSDE